MNHTSEQNPTRSSFLPSFIYSKRRSPEWMTYILILLPRRCCLCLSFTLFFCSALQNSDEHYFSLSLDSICGLNVIPTEFRSRWNVNGDLMRNREQAVVADKLGRVKR